MINFHGSKPDHSHPHQYHSRRIRPLKQDIIHVFIKKKFEKTGDCEVAFVIGLVGSPDQIVKYSGRVNPGVYRVLFIRFSCQYMKRE